MNPNIEELVRQAAARDDVSAVSALVDAYGSNAARMEGNPSELTALHWAAASGALRVVNYLLSPTIQADPRAARNNNFTPLHGAAMHGHTAVCEALLRAGAAVDAQTDPQRYAPLHSAAFASHLDTIRLLLAHGADRGLMNYRDERPMDTARRQGHAEAALLLTPNASAP